VLDSEFDNLLDTAVGNSGILGDLVVTPSFPEDGQERLGFPLALLGLRGELFVHALFDGEIRHVAELVVGRAECGG
jgi:hypothetical protein